MAYASINGVGSVFGTQLEALLNAEDIAPGSDVSYETAKLVYLYHPLGGKIA